MPAPLPRRQPGKPIGHDFTPWDGFGEPSPELRDRAEHGLERFFARMRLQDQEDDA
ncbi:hypothetical protein ACGFYU_32635 [Streptomyces sp. NPDC048337]|uniref:hypothetical protein n=1 Tax=Streptomyces sp. NPDC048337 TaxID=3365535 RepID=UPI00371ABB40